MIKSWGDQRLPGAAGAEFPGAGGGGRRKGIEVGNARGGRVMLGRCWDCDHTILIWCLDDNSVGQILQKVKLKFASKFGVNLGLKTSTSTSKLPPNITKHHNFTLFYVMPTWTECFRPFPPFYLNFLFQHFFLPSSKGIVPRGTYWLRRKHFERIWREDGMLAEVLGALTGLQVIDRRKYWVSAEAESGNW